VFGGKFAIADGLREFGIDPDEVRVGGEFASAYSTEKLTNAQRAKLVAGLEAVYGRFTSLVAEGRNLPPERVQEVARGRVWSGETAKTLGLIDQTGDLIDAIDKAKELAGFKPDDRVSIRMRLYQASPLDLLGQAMTMAKASSGEHKVVEALAPLVGRQRAAAVIGQLRQLSREGGARVWMPPLIER